MKNQARRDGFLNENELGKSIWFPTPNKALLLLAQQDRNRFSVCQRGTVIFYGGIEEFAELGWTGKILNLKGEWEQLGRFFPRNAQQDAAVEHARSITLDFFS